MKEATTFSDTVTAHDGLEQSVVTRPNAALPGYPARRGTGPVFPMCGKRGHQNRFDQAYRPSPVETPLPDVGGNAGPQNVAGLPKVLQILTAFSPLFQTTRVERVRRKDSTLGRT